MPLDPLPLSPLPGPPPSIECDILYGRSLSQFLDLNSVLKESVRCTDCLKNISIYPQSFFYILTICKCYQTHQLSYLIPNDWPE